MGGQHSSSYPNPGPVVGVIQGLVGGRIRPWHNSMGRKGWG